MSNKVRFVDNLKVGAYKVLSDEAALPSGSNAILNNLYADHITSPNISGSFTGSFSGDGSQLADIPASAITGLNLNQISSGSVSASISPDKGLEVNTNLDVSGSIEADSFIRSGSTSDDVLLGDGTTTSLSSIGGDLNLQDITDNGSTTSNNIKVESSGGFPPATNYTEIKDGSIVLRADDGFFSNTTTLIIPVPGFGNASNTVTFQKTSGTVALTSDIPLNIIDGFGTVNYLSKFSDGNTITISSVYESGSNIGIGTTTPSQPLTVEGNISGSGNLNIQGNVTATSFTGSFQGDSFIKSGSTSDDILLGDGSTTALSALTGSTGGTPAGADTQIQFNDAGAFGASSGLTWNNTTEVLEATKTDTTLIDLDSGMTYIQSPDGGQFGVGSTGANGTGYLQIKFPIDYTVDSGYWRLSFQLQCTSQTSRSNFVAWCQMTWNLSSVLSGPTVRQYGGDNLLFNFSNDASNVYLFVGDATTTWSRCSFKITDVVVNWAVEDVEIWRQGWEISIGATKPAGTVSGRSVGSANLISPLFQESVSFSVTISGWHTIAEFETTSSNNGTGFIIVQRLGTNYMKIYFDYGNYGDTELRVESVSQLNSDGFQGVRLVRDGTVEKVQIKWGTYSNSLVSTKIYQSSPIVTLAQATATGTETVFQSIEFVGRQFGIITVNDITTQGDVNASGFVIPSGTSDDILLADGTTTSLSGSIVPIEARVGFAAKNSNTTVPATAFTRVTFSIEIEDTNSAWDGSVFTVPVGQGGIYEILGHATFASINDGTIAIVGVEVNGSLSNGGLLGRGYNGATGLGGFGGGLRLNLSAGDELEMVVYCGNATNLFNTSQDGYSTFSAYKMR